MTLTKGDHLVIKRNGKLVEGEAYHEFEVIDLSPTYLELMHVKGNPSDNQEVIQFVKLRKVE